MSCSPHRVALCSSSEARYNSAAQANEPHYTRIRGNNVSRYISWSLQTRYDDKGEMIPHDEMNKIFAEEEPEAWERFCAWKEGQTGFPWIDALMRQVRAEGWMHHLGRHSVACFLTRGQLYVSWERVRPCTSISLLSSPI